MRYAIASYEEGGRAVRYAIASYEEGGREYLVEWLNKEVKDKRISREEADDLWETMYFSLEISVFRQHCFLFF